MMSFELRQILPAPLESCHCSCLATELKVPNDDDDNSNKNPKEATRIELH